MSAASINAAAALRAGCPYLALFILGVLTGCGPAHVVIKPVPVEVTKYVKQPIPPALVQPCTYEALTPACTRNGKPELCNDQLLTERNGYRNELALCDADKTVLREKFASP